MGDPLMLGTLPRVTGDELTQLQRACTDMLGSAAGRFPGSQPVSFGRTHLQSVQRQHYFVAEKTDGMRYMLLILGDKGAFVVDRHFGMRELPMRFPGPKPGTLLDNTLLDGELVVDTSLETNERKMRYLIYDACAVAGELITGYSLTYRLAAVRRFVRAPQSAAADQPFTIDLKDYYELEHLSWLFKHIAPSRGEHLFTFVDENRGLRHGTDGIIFTPVDAPYRHETDPLVLKWKPAEMNSVDFRLAAVWRREEGQGLTPRFQLLVSDGGALAFYAWIAFSPQDYQRFRYDPKCDERIVECVRDPNWVTIEYDLTYPTWNRQRRSEGGWRFLRVREDKNEPNRLTTVQSVVRSIKDGVTKEEILAVGAVFEEAAEKRREEAKRKSGGASVAAALPSLAQLSL
jgi:mRNA guanylyltransferase